MNSEALFHSLARLLGLYLMIEAVLRAAQIPMSYVALMNSELAVRERTSAYLALSSVGVALMFAIGFWVFKYFRRAADRQELTSEFDWQEIALYAVRLLSIYFIAVGFVEGFKTISGIVLVEGTRAFYVNQLIQASVSLVGGWVLLALAKPISRLVTRI
jgi:Na+-translocating ferredoxin:NAD+ oxidoreductase RnfA subunit